MIGCIGLGRMGSQMARRLAMSGEELVGYDIDSLAAEPLGAIGMHVASSAAEVASICSVIFTSLPGPSEVETVIGEIERSAKRATIVVETSTIGVRQSRENAERCARRGISYLDAPVSGGVEAARDGTLTMMVGGESEVLETARPLLRRIASRIDHVGPAGSGSLTKAINQMIYLSYVAIFCEGTGLAKTAGLPVPTVVALLRDSVAGKPLSTHWEEALLTDERSGGFVVRRVLKDLSVVAEACETEHYYAPVFASVLETFRELAQAGAGEQGMSALFDLRSGTSGKFG